MNWRPPVFTAITVIGVLGGSYLYSQIQSGGIASAPASTFDFSSAGVTKPFKILTSDPGTCSVGELYVNNNANPAVLKICTATNTWTPVGTTNITGNVTGPNSSVVGAVPQWNNTSGTLLQAGLPVSTVQSGNSLVKSLNSGLLDITLFPNPLNVTILGNAATATAAATIGSECGAGQAARGVDASWNARDCFTPAGGGGGGLADPGSNGIIKRTALNVTAVAVAGTDYALPYSAGTGTVVIGNTIAIDSAYVATHTSVVNGTDHQCTDVGVSTTAFTCTLSALVSCTVSSCVLPDRMGIDFTAGHSFAGGATTLTINGPVNGSVTKKVFQNDGVSNPTVNQVRANITRRLYYNSNLDSFNGAFTLP